MIETLTCGSESINIDFDNAEQTQELRLLWAKWCRYRGVTLGKKGGRPQATNRCVCGRYRGIADRYPGHFAPDGKRCYGIGSIL
jgi:hypothetical protein